MTPSHPQCDVAPIALYLSVTKLAGKQGGRVRPPRRGEFDNLACKGLIAYRRVSRISAGNLFHGQELQGKPGEGHGRAGRESKGPKSRISGGQSRFAEGQGKGPLREKQRRGVNPKDILSDQESAEAAECRASLSPEGIGRQDHFFHMLTLGDKLIKAVEKVNLEKERPSSDF